MILKIYQFLTSFRRKLYKNGFFKVKKLKKPVISVGNISFGGSGKTTFVLRLAKELIEKGLKVSIISRGYKRKSKGLVPVSDGNKILADVWEAGDEPYLLAISLPKAIVTVCEDRFLAGKFAEEENEVDLHILDDGFQHFKLWRDFEIVLVRDLKLLREPICSLKKADFVFFVKELNEKVKVFLEKNLIPYEKIDYLNYGFFTAENKPVDIEWVKENIWVALAGIFKNENFFKDLEKYGIRIVKSISFKDHFYPEERDIKKLEEIIKKTGAKGVIMTQKDIYKWKGDFISIFHKVNFPPLGSKFLDKILKIL